MLHTSILNDVNALIDHAGDRMRGYGWMRVLETLIQIGEHENPPNALIAATLKGLNQAMADASTAGPFEVIDVRDTRTDSQIAAEVFAPGRLDTY